MEVGPGPWLILSGEQVERGNDVGKVGNKFVIEIRKSKERVNTFDGGRGFPFLDSREFDGVHFDLSLSDDHA